MTVCDGQSNITMHHTQEVNCSWITHRLLWSVLWTWTVS